MYRYEGRPGDHTPGVFYGPHGAVPMRDLTAEEAIRYGVLDTDGVLNLMFERIPISPDEIDSVEDNEEGSE